MPFNGTELTSVINLVNRKGWFDYLVEGSILDSLESSNKFNPGSLIRPLAADM